MSVGARFLFSSNVVRVKQTSCHHISFVAVRVLTWLSGKPLLLYRTSWAALIAANAHC